MTMVEEDTLGRCCISYVLNDKRALAGAQLVINGYVKSSQSNNNTSWLALCGEAQIPLSI